MELSGINTHSDDFCKDKCVNTQICEILFGGIFIPKSPIFARKMQINAMFFVSVYQGFLWVARKNAGLSNYEFKSYN